MNPVSIHFDPADPGAALVQFLTERHLATLTTLSDDGVLHVVPVGFTYQPGLTLARIITFASSRKARNVAQRPGGPAALCQLDGRRWVSLHGQAFLRDDEAANAEAVARYAARYRPTRSRPDRVTIEVMVTKIIGNLGPVS